MAQYPKALKSAHVSGLSERTCVSLHEVLNQVQEGMDKEVEKGDKIRGWKMAEIQTLLHAYSEPCTDLRLNDGACGIRKYEKLKESVEDEIKRTVKDLRIYTIFSMTRNKQKLRGGQNLLRWFIAIFTGAAVLVPMIIMVLGIPHQKDSKAWPRVGTVVVATVLFATFVAWASTSSHQDLMVAVATYAAVLVVFVGTQTSVS
ncbi:hypothetical protein LTS10_013051 [Elasticomyces elasticus]|nr:hypothetical protein LTS10_013051 [Elasticomyces elasticus]